MPTTTDTDPTTSLPPHGPNPLPAPSPDKPIIANASLLTEAPTVGLAEALSNAVYAYLNPGAPITAATSDANNLAFWQQVVNPLQKDGWALISDGEVTKQMQSGDQNYEGVAFYSATYNEVVIANRGSRDPYDFYHSDARILVGSDPDADGDALNFYNAVVRWLTKTDSTATTATILETGHSLGGQEALHMTPAADNAAWRILASVAVSTQALDFPTR